MRGSAAPIFKHNIAEYDIMSEFKINTHDKRPSEAGKTGIYRKRWSKWRNTRASKKKTSKNER